MMINNPRLGKEWKKNLNKIFNKSSKNFGSQIEFQSINTGRHLGLQECLYNDLLPVSFTSSTISSICSADNAWIATSMLSRVQDTTNNLVVLEKGFPVGIISNKEILKGLIKNPTPYFFHDIDSKEIMNRKFYLDTRRAKLDTIFNQMQETNRSFVIIQNSKYGFSAISIREILEIGALCKTNLKISEVPERKLKIFRRDDSTLDLLKNLTPDGTDLLMLENESMFIDGTTILEKISSDLNYLKDVDNFHELSASVYKLQNPKLIPETLNISEVCKLMLHMSHPYVMTSNRIWTPTDILQSFIEGFDS